MSFVERTTSQFMSKRTRFGCSIGLSVFAAVLMTASLATPSWTVASISGGGQIDVGVNVQCTSSVGGIEGSAVCEHFYKPDVCLENKERIKVPYCQDFVGMRASLFLSFALVLITAVTKCFAACCCPPRPGSRECDRGGCAPCASVLTVIAIIAGIAGMIMYSRFDNRIQYFLALAPVSGHSFGYSFYMFIVALLLVLAEVILECIICNDNPNNDLEGLSLEERSYVAYNEQNNFNNSTTIVPVQVSGGYMPPPMHPQPPMPMYGGGYPPQPTGMGYPTMMMQSTIQPPMQQQQQPEGVSNGGVLQLEQEHEADGSLSQPLLGKEYA